MDFKQSAELRYKNTPVQEFATPMVYAKDTEPKNVDFIIAQGSHDGLNYYVRNVECRHPTAYIEIPQGHKAYNMDFNNWEYNIIDVHGGGACPTSLPTFLASTRMASATTSSSAGTTVTQVTLKATTLATNDGNALTTRSGRPRRSSPSASGRSTRSTVCEE